ncbi:MAG: hypothetical protein V9G19_17295 [Tetrasphaera sp.]
MTTITTGTPRCPTSAETTSTLILSTQGPFSLRRTALVGFGHRAEKDWDDVMRLAFTVDGTHEHTAGVEVRQEGEILRLTITSAADHEAVAAQTARVLSVHVDGVGFAELAERDPVAGALHAAAAGLRPPQFYSPYEAAAWSILSARRSAAQGRVLRQRLSERVGTAYDLAGKQVWAFPTPSKLATVTELQSLPDASIPRLHAIAAAALDGLLNPARLLAMETEEIREEVQRLPGIGPFYSALIAYRSLGLPNVLALIEPRSRSALERLCGATEPMSDDAFTARADAWRPYRMWMTFLARAVGDRVPTPLA